MTSLTFRVRLLDFRGDKGWLGWYVGTTYCVAYQGNTRQYFRSEQVSRYKMINDETTSNFQRWIRNSFYTHPEDDDTAEAGIAHPFDTESGRIRVLRLLRKCNNLPTVLWCFPIAAAIFYGVQEKKKMTTTTTTCRWWTRDDPNLLWKWNERQGDGRRRQEDKSPKCWM